MGKENEKLRKLENTERVVLFKYDEPITIGNHKVEAIKQVPKGIRFRTENGPVLVEVEAKETWTEEELHELLNNK
jgi:hypothetical protein